mmetsp:Transcript_103406/g.269963  ORF Transcript_103406/g.269963 Transcript_103406/m.269963 type:complete len:261 (-) Transcript_103406:1214-1996(-)
MSEAEMSQMAWRKTGAESSREASISRVACSFFSWSSSACAPATSCIFFMTIADFATLETACTLTLVARMLSRHETSCASSVKLPCKDIKNSSAFASYTAPMVRNKRPPNETCVSSFASWDIWAMNPASSRSSTHLLNWSRRLTAHLTSRRNCWRCIHFSFLPSLCQRISRSRASPRTSRAGAPSEPSSLRCRSKSFCRPFASLSVCIATHSLPMYLSNCSEPKSMLKKSVGSTEGIAFSLIASFPRRSYRSRSFGSLSTW